MGIEVSEVINILGERYDRVFQEAGWLSRKPGADFGGLQFTS